MSLQLKTNSRNRNIKLAASVGAVIIGAGYIVLTTFPHLKSTICSTLLGSKKPDVKGTDDNEPIELYEDSESEYEDSDSEDAADTTEALNEESIVNVEKWSDENLKSWLSEVCIITLGYLKIHIHILTYLERNHSSVQCFS